MDFTLSEEQQALQTAARGRSGFPLSPRERAGVRATGC